MRKNFLKLYEMHKSGVKITIYVRVCSILYEYILVHVCIEYIIYYKIEKI